MLEIYKCEIRVQHIRLLIITFWKLVFISIIHALSIPPSLSYNPDKQTNKHTYNNRVLIIRALRSRSLRDGLLSHKGRFATFVRSYWTPQKITHKYVKPVTSKLHAFN